MKRLLLVPALVLAASFAVPAAAAPRCEKGVDVNCSTGTQSCVVYVAILHGCLID